MNVLQQLFAAYRQCVYGEHHPTKIECPQHVADAIVDDGFTSAIEFHQDVWIKVDANCPRNKIRILNEQYPNDPSYNCTLVLPEVLA